MSLTALYRRIRQVARRVRPHIVPRYYKLHEHAVRATRRRSRTVVETHAGGDPNAGSGRVAVFVHFDRGGNIHDYVLRYIESLRDAGFRIRLMSNSPRLQPAAISRVLPLVASIHRRNNFGLDFGAYKDGIVGALQEGVPDQLLVCNDSVYGPFRPLAPLLEQMTPEGADVWGMTESYEMLYHLQSYFLLFHRRALENTAFQQHWCELPYVDARGWLIHYGELALTQSLLKAGLSVRALYPNEALAAAVRRRWEADVKLEAEKEPPLQRDRKRHEFRARLLDNVDAGWPLNPTHFFWDILIEDLGYPYIKRDLLQDNPVRIPNVSDWRRLVASSGYDVEVIRRHLLPRLKNRSI